ncbi:tetratricopeptide repeat protein [Methylophaga sp. OBS3]|uniref:tetratricopeptide repeat protein n=1 Tax=Methylophaga sp. OBS3 TaxID=2991934 RepID=UPI00224D2446|nr:tetratricopeptide repeat protein [Methylophaga sp. OBS3]MCX4189606.1 tetratricopeptide repeat protein [Methylophaga sp. OBS3]
MDLLQQFWFGTRQIIRGTALLGLPIFLLACAATPAQQKQTEAEPEAMTTDDTEMTYLPLSSELVYYILTAEIAGQRGQIGIASDLYQKAADTIESPALAERAARVATFSRDKGRINKALDRWQSVDPNDADVLVMQVPFLLNEKQFNQVITTMDKAISLSPEKSPVYLATFSEHLSDMVDGATALPMMRRLESYRNNDPEARFAYARMAAFYKEYDLALTEIDALLAKQPNHEPFLALKSEVLQRNGDPERALKLIAKAAQKPGASEELRFSYAKLLGENGETAKAQAVFEELNLENPDNKEVLFALGLLALENGDGQTAKTYFTDLLRKGDPAQQAGYFMGLAEEMNGNIDAALVWFASVPADSQRFDSAQGRYISLLAEQGDVDKARNHLKLMRQERPGQAREFFLFEAAFLQEQDMSKEAMSVYDEALLQFPNDFELLYSRAMLAESQNDIPKLEADLRKILEIDPDNAQALNALGYTLTDRTDRHQEALLLIERALELKPGDPFFLDSLGWVYYRMGNLDLAEKYLRQAIAVQPDAEFNAHLGEVLWQQGKKGEAQAVWQAAKEQDADNKVLNETLERFNQ